MRGTRALARGLWGLVSLVGPLAVPDAAGTVEPPTLRVERQGERYLLWVETVRGDGVMSRRFLRDSSSVPRPDRCGWDPSGHAAFVTWVEGDPPVLWSSFSRDAGASWAGARPLSGELRLHAGAVRPGEPLPDVPEGLRLPPHGQLHLVQFTTVSLPEWRAALRSLGAEIVAFFPREAHIVRLPPGLRERVASLDFVRRVEPYHPGYRLERELGAWLRASADGDAAESRHVNVLASGWGPEGKGRIARFAEGLGARVAAFWLSGHVLELWVSRTQLRLLAAHDEVVWIDRWSAPETDMDLVRQDSGAQAWEETSGSCGQGVRGEVLDSGCETTHQDFDGILLHGPNDPASHGTNVYGVVFGNGARDGDGDAQATGLFPCAEQGMFADFEYLVDRFADTQELKQAPYFASFQTNSWGGARTTEYTSQSHELDDIAWRLDIAITQSQSNSGDQDSRPEAWAKNVTSVGGIYHRDTLDTPDDAWSSGSSIGPAADGRIKPDLSYWYDSIYTTTTSNGYRSNFGGTSAATPHVAGVLGLIVQMWSENVWATNPEGSTVFERQPHASTIKALVIHNAQQYPFSGISHDLTRTHQGWGRPSAELARQRAARSLIVDEELPLEIGESATYSVSAPADEVELKVTLVYPDPPGTTSATLHRINDLDLVVTSPSDTLYHGNHGLDTSTQSSPGGSPNAIDTVENVFLVDPEPGLWTIEVVAAEINQDAHLATLEDDAAFALVVTGATLAPPAGTPGEAGTPEGGRLLVTSYDEATDVLSLTYGATDHVIEYGELTPGALQGYAWSGQVCGLGTGGTHDWNTAGAPESTFFVVVGQDSTVEGSYGKDSAGQERPEDIASAGCPRPQDLSSPCP